MKSIRTSLQIIIIIAVLGTISCNFIHKETTISEPVNTSRHPAPITYSPITEFDKLAPLQTDRFYMARSGSGKNKGMTYDHKTYDGGRYFYNYEDGRYDKWHKPNMFDKEIISTDVTLIVSAMPSEADAQAFIKKRLADSVPAADYEKKVKLPKCNAEAEQDYQTPYEFIKSIPHKNGTSIYVFHPPKIWDGDCNGKKIPSKGETEEAVWSDGKYVYVIETSGFFDPEMEEKRITGYETAQDFLPDFLKAANQN